MEYPGYKEVSTLIPSPVGTANFLTVPANGTKVRGCSVFILHSIACPLIFIASCLNDNPFPKAILSCCSTMSTPVTASVTGCSTCILALTYIK